MKVKICCHSFYSYSFMTFHLNRISMMIESGLHGGVVPGLNPSWGLSVWSLHVLAVYVLVPSRYSSFFPLFKNMHFRLSGDSKLALGVSGWLLGCCLVCLCAAL